ncbi:hypothetical protein Cal6303_3107 [Calothrix sp. PCC 6303]|nr:hypothetical protein Cal6303_3107 [Calothrix sp. PCC 6303]
MKLFNNILTVISFPTVFLCATFLITLPGNGLQIASFAITLKDTNSPSIQGNGLKKFIANVKSAQATITPIINEQSTPLDHLKAAPRPVFKKSHTLLPLTQGHCGLSRETYIELSDHWGYALPIDKNNLSDVAKAKPGHYRTTVGMGVQKFFDNYDESNTDFPKLPSSTWLRDKNGKIILVNGRAIVSPSAPDETFQIIGDFFGQQFAQLETAVGQSIDIITNQGESGLWILGDDGPRYMEQDPTVLAKYNESNTGSWNGFVSYNKARQERVLKESLFKSLRSRPIYSWYQESYGPERGRWGNWWSWMLLYDYFLEKYGYGKPLVSDYPAPEMYYKLHNSGWTGVNYNSMVPDDALTKALNDVSGTISMGQKFTYPWVNMGWEDNGSISEPDRFMGMMKTYYTAGAIGVSGQYFQCSGPIWDALIKNKPVATKTPTLIQQLSILGHVHGLFSHLEGYLRNGDLLAGSNQHTYSGKNGVKVLPAMEFIAEGETKKEPGLYGLITIPTARVLARKMIGEDRWLVTTWANVGEDRDIRVKIDNRLGSLTLRARKAGSVYVVKLINGLTQITLVDTDPMNPTKNLPANSSL